MLFLDDAETVLKVIDDYNVLLLVSDMRTTISTILDDLEIQRSTMKPGLVAIAAYMKTERHRIKLEEHMAVSAALQEAQDQASFSASRMDNIARTIGHTTRRENAELSDHADCIREADAGTKIHGISLCTTCVENLRETAFDAGQVYVSQSSYLHYC